VIRVPTQTLTRPPQAAADREHQDSLRALALEHVYRIRRFKLHLVAFAVGLPALTAVWVVTEYFEENTWPSRFASDPDVAGTWDPWLFFVAGLWLIGLVIHALRTYLGPPVGPVGRYIRRPVSEDEIERQVKRLHG
jgi:hypothetical protein